jgi:hypothetical protein
MIPRAPISFLTVSCVLALLVTSSQPAIADPQPVWTTESVAIHDPGGAARAAETIPVTRPGDKSSLMVLSPGCHAGTES